MTTYARYVFEKDIKIDDLTIVKLVAQHNTLHYFDFIQSFRRSIYKMLMYRLCMGSYTYTSEIRKDDSTRLYFARKVRYPSYLVSCTSVVL